MIGMNILLGVFIFLFALIGFIRGGSKEGLVTSAVLLGLYLISISEKYIPIIKDFSTQAGGTILAFRLAVLCLLLFFGYQTPSYERAAAGDRFIRNGASGLLFGIFLGAINGYLIFGSLWYFLNNNGNPFSIIVAAADPKIAELANHFIPYLPPSLLAEPVIYFAVALPLLILMAIFI